MVQKLVVSAYEWLFVTALTTNLIVCFVCLCCTSFPCVALKVIRYNRLLVVVHQTLKDLLKALKGLVVMSEALETMFNSIYNNAVPELWAAKVWVYVYTRAITIHVVLIGYKFSQHIAPKVVVFQSWDSNQ